MLVLKIKIGSANPSSYRHRTKHISVRAIATALVLALSACHDTGKSPDEIPQIIRDINARKDAMSPEAAALYRKLRSNGPALVAFLSNTSARTYNSLHGTQVEFLGADGQTALWYAGNSAPVRGKWMVKPTFDGPDMCFLYGENTYNPVTREGGGLWECGDASLYLLGLVEAVDGDVFRLGSGQVPFVLSKNNATLEQLASRAGVGRLGQNKVSW